MSRIDTKRCYGLDMGVEEFWEFGVQCTCGVLVCGKDSRVVTSEVGKNHHVK